MSITEARARELIADARQLQQEVNAATILRNGTDNGSHLIDQLADAIESLLAALPETPTTVDLRGHTEGVAYADDIAEGGDPVPEDYERHYCEWDGEDWPCSTVRPILEAGYALPSPPTEEQWEYGAALRQADGTIWDVDIESSLSGAIEARQLAESSSDDYAPDVCIVVRRQKPVPAGPWEPLEAAARVGGEPDA